jgi:hypothetical protein
MKLTKFIADRAKYEGVREGRCVLWDSEIKGFGLRVYPSGRKSFIYHYRVRGRMRLLTLGDFGVLTVDGSPS